MGKRQRSFQSRQCLIHGFLPLEGERLQNQDLDDPPQAAFSLQLLQQQLRQPPKQHHIRFEPGAGAAGSDTGAPEGKEYRNCLAGDPEVLSIVMPLF